MKIGGVITKEARWAQNCLGRDKNGLPLQSFDTTYLTSYNKSGQISYQEFRLEDLAYSFSLYGAVIKCYEADKRHGVLEKLRHAIRKVSGRNQYIAEFNNAATTTFEDIRQVLRLSDV